MNEFNSLIMDLLEEGDSNKLLSHTSEDGLNECLEYVTHKEKWWGLLYTSLFRYTLVVPFILQLISVVFWLAFFGTTSPVLSLSFTAIILVQIPLGTMIHKKKMKYMKHRHDITMAILTREYRIRGR